MKYSAINSTNTITNFINSTGKARYLHFVFIFILSGLFLLLTACEEVPLTPEKSASGTVSADIGQHRAATPNASYTFSGPVFDIAATPNGSILVAETVFSAIVPAAGQSTSIIKEIHRGTVRKVAEIRTIKGSPINGLAVVGRRSFYATSGALDEATGGKLFHVTRAGAREVADIGKFERINDPDAFFGLQWKDRKCEGLGPYTAGPQSNPYHLTMLSGSTALVADAAGNSLLAVKRNGDIELVAVFTPPTGDGSGSTDPDDWLNLIKLADGTDCYVQPVPTSVAIGPDGAYYVGELTGAVAGGLPTDLSRVWRIEEGARNIVCPSEDCRVVASGFTSILDVAFGPDGKLYVVEYDENSWLELLSKDPTLAGGTINRCDLEANRCSEIATNLVLPGAITFDKRGNLWVLENTFAPKVYRLDLR